MMKTHGLRLGLNKLFRLAATASEIFAVGLLLALLTNSNFAFSSSSAGGNTGTPQADAIHIGIPSDLESGSFGSIGDLMAKITTVLAWIMGVASTIAILVGALLYIISGGDPSKTRIAKDAILYAVVGLIIALLAYAIVTLVIGKAN